MDITYETHGIKMICDAMTLKELMKLILFNEKYQIIHELDPNAKECGGGKLYKYSTTSILKISKCLSHSLP